MRQFYVMIDNRVHGASLKAKIVDILESQAFLKRALSQPERHTKPVALPSLIIPFPVFQ